MALYIDDRELVAAHQAGDSDAFDDFDAMQAHFYPEVLLQVHLSDVIDDLSIDSNLLCKQIFTIIGESG